MFAVGVLLFAACAVNPATGKRQLMLVSEGEEIQMGAQYDSQVVLSMQLPFAVIPLVRFVSDRKLMGCLVIPRWLAGLAWAIAAAIVVLNAKLLFDTVAGALN